MFAPTSDNQRLLSVGARFYVVQRRDTLSQIGAKLRCNWRNLARMNGIRNPDLIFPGQLIAFPTGDCPLAGRGISRRDKRK